MLIHICPQTTRLLFGICELLDMFRKKSEVIDHLNRQGNVRCYGVQLVASSSPFLRWHVRHICSSAPGTAVSGAGDLHTACLPGRSWEPPDQHHGQLVRLEGGRREDSALCATARKRECSSGRRGRTEERKGRKTRWGVEENREQPKQQVRGQVLSSTARVIQADAAELPGSLPSSSGRRLPSRPDSR